jgi:hypothetical protein
MTTGNVAPPQEWRFLQLTLFIAAWMLLAPGVSDRWLVHVLLQLFLLNSLLVTMWANPKRRRLRRVMLGLWVVSLASSLVVAVFPLGAMGQHVVQTVESASSIPLLALLAAGMLTYAFQRRRLSLDGVFATIASYLLIIFLFAEVYLLLLAWNPEAFHLPTPAAERAPNLLQGDMVYYSAITMATVGYGDLLPVSSTARALAVLEAVVGQFYVAVVVAVFVGMLTAQQRE